jgi:hypothetical protein
MKTRIVQSHSKAHIPIFPCDKYLRRINHSHSASGVMHRLYRPSNLHNVRPESPLRDDRRLRLHSTLVKGGWLRL